MEELNPRPLIFFVSLHRIWQSHYFMDLFLLFLKKWEKHDIFVFCLKDTLLQQKFQKNLVKYIQFVSLNPNDGTWSGFSWFHTMLYAFIEKQHICL